jgi:mono/diheme cytochrome c family protein
MRNGIGHLSVPLLAGALALAATASRSGAQAAAVPIASADTGAITHAQVDQGRALYHGRGTCLACHGTKLEGTAIAPKLLPHKWKDAANGDLSAISRVIRVGVPGTAMVARPGGVTDAQAAALAAYVWSVGHGTAKP